MYYSHKNHYNGGQRWEQPNNIYLFSSSLIAKNQVYKVLLKKDNKKEPNLMAIYAISISLMRDVLLIVAKERHHFPTDLSF